MPWIWKPPERTESNYIRTHSGIKFWPLNPRAMDVDINDIAHALANNCRYTGHTSKFYSVAEHSVHVSKLVADEFALAGLLHDAAEAYIADIAKPIKPYFSNYSEIEDALTETIYKRYEVPFDSIPYQVKAADVYMLEAEMSQLMPGHNVIRKYDSLGYSPLGARELFLNRFGELYYGK